MNDKERPYAPRPHNWRWGAGALLAAALIVLVVLFRGHSPPAVAPSKSSSLTRSSLPAVPKPAVAAPRPPIDNTGDGADKIEICGLGKVLLDTNDPFAAGRYIGTSNKTAVQHWLSALLASDDYRARAVGLFLEGKITDGLAMQPIAEQSRDALVQLAVGTRDPAVYAIAVHACDAYGDPASGACQQISVREWARIDADNATPWLLLAGIARAKNNQVAEADAFSQAAKAHKIDSYFDSLFAFAESDLPRDVTPLDRWFLAVEVIGIESATAVPQYSFASKHCSAEAVQDRTVRQQCGALAEVLATKGTTLLDLSLGANIGARVGWPKGRVSGLAEERDALMEAIMRATPTSNGDLWTCNGVELGNAYIRQRVQLGELGAAREALDRSGETVQELARKHREYIEKLQRDAMQRQVEMPPESAPEGR
jgi:hypothetical protein